MCVQLRHCFLLSFLIFIVASWTKVGPKLDESWPGVGLELMVLLRNISIAYETILPTKLLKKIGNLRTHIKKCLYDNEAPYNKNDMEKCISLLVEVVTELKKEKKVI